MTTANLPPARERNRYGLRPFLAPHPPEAAEAMLDKVVLRVTGQVRAESEKALDDFAALIGSCQATATDAAPRLFGVGSWNGRKWTARRVEGTTIGGGELNFHRHERQRNEAGINLELWINPIRTLGHLLDRYPFEDIAGLSPLDFFRPTLNATATRRALDHRDNMIADFLSFSGTTQKGMVQRVANYLTAFEQALMGRVILELCPPEQGFTHSDDYGEVVATNGRVDLRLSWNTLNVSQCEVCWERHDPDALAKVHVVADRVLTSARTVEVQTYPDAKAATIERVLGAISVKVPLVQSGGIVLVVYAKAVDRLRIEVRYLSDIPQQVRERLSGSPRRLTDWFDALRHDAAPRIPWGRLKELLSVRDEPTLDAMLDLLEAVADVTDKCKNKRRGLLQQMLTHGAVTASNRDGATPSSVLERLTRRGVVEHVRLVGKDAEIGRRYRLTSRYAGLVGWVTAGAATDLGDDTLPSL